MGKEKKRYIVSFREIKKGKEKQEQLNIFKGKGEVIRNLEGVGAAVVELSEEAVKGLENNPSIVAIEEDFSEPQPNEPPSTDKEVWDWNVLGTDVLKFWGKQYRGQNVRVALLDSGYSDHPDLEGRIDEAINFTQAGNSPKDPDGHGTSAHGVIGAIRNNSMGYASYAPECKMSSLKVSHHGSELAAVASALDHVASNVDNYDVVVANVQLTSSSFVVKRSVNLLRANGVVVVSAAGNYEDPYTYGEDTPDKLMACPAYPARYKNVLGIGAVSSTYAVATYSCGAYNGENNYGATTDLMAPTINGGYRNYSGTSCATPSAGGVFAILKSAYPTLGVELLASILDKGLRTDIRSYYPDVDPSFFIGKGFMRFTDSMLPENNYPTLPNGGVPREHLLGRLELLSSFPTLTGSLSEEFDSIASGFLINCTTDKEVVIDGGFTKAITGFSIKVYVDGVLHASYNLSESKPASNKFTIPLSAGKHSVEVRFVNDTDYPMDNSVMMMPPIIKDPEQLRIGYRMSHAKTSYDQITEGIKIHTIVGNEAKGLIDNYPLEGAVVTHELRLKNSDGTTTRYKTLSATTGADGRTVQNTFFSTAYPKGNYTIRTVIQYQDADPVVFVGHDFSIV